MANKIKYTYKKKSMAMDSAKVGALAENPSELDRLGVVVTDDFMSQSGGVPSFALDSITAGVTTPATGTPVQFLQAFLPGVVYVLTKVRKADYIAPVSTAGAWHMKEIVLKVMEHTGSPRFYSDHGGIPFSSFNETYVTRQVLQFELGVMLTKLADERAAATGTNPQAVKRTALANAFEILRNDIAFNGFDVGNGETYGLLNDPLLPAYVTVDANASGDTEWADKTVADRISNLLTAASALRVQSGGNVDPKKDSIKLTMPLSVVDLLNSVDESTGSSKSVQQWITENYSNWTIEDAPQFDSANAGDNVFYLSADSVDDGSSDDNVVMTQIVPAKMVALGSEQKAKGSLEAYTAAYAGVFVKRAYAIVRYSGI